ncbi:MAG: hypothetical protein V1809_14955 [Planctomycetota bacterium]
MSTTFMSLKDFFPAERVSNDLRRVLEEGGWKIELGGRITNVPPSAPIDILARSCHVYDYDIGFGNHYRVLTALGGILHNRNGVIEASLGFATLWYSEERNLITVDFSAAMP